MNTNIDIDESLIDRAMDLTGLRTKRAVVEEALWTLVRLYDQREVRDLRGRLHWDDGRQGAAKKRSRRGGGASSR
jgi:Arc/MetJ family transcription regulator